MRKIVIYLLSLAFVLVGAAVAYFGDGYLDARSDGDAFRERADALIAGGLGAAGLGEGRAEMLLAVQDPGFADHAGVDLTTPGAGITTMTQSLAKRLGFDAFRPGVGKIRQTGFAMGLERELSKEQIFALFLDTVEMGRGPDGWMTGFYGASEAVYGASVADIADGQFLSLVAVMIAPGVYHLRAEDAELGIRVDRIARMLEGACAPLGPSDVWLDGCA
ncbi:transglycosylase domain-containing protein [Aestuariibius sp. 2305UL40-4]|uniref:transglycosylase domain-containing protein n=1 Tax=Aestuariibius violaceus TaxID=3234132 RepID=UPI00345E7DE1